MRCKTAGLLLSLALWVSASPAQQLDMDYLPKQPAVQPSSTSVESIRALKNNPSPQAATATRKPLSITVSKTLYLPPAMYGQWSVSGVLLETNVEHFFSPTVNDIWILQRDGDQVTVTNPANGASATINVDRVEGDEATFHREGPAGRNRYFMEIPTIRVSGDTMVGTSLNKFQYLKDGDVTREYYAVYQLQAERISGARVMFKPENMVNGPDIVIEDVQIRR